MNIDTLPFTEIWAVDFEYIQQPGEVPKPVCMVASELRTGRELRVWRGGFGPRAPFDCGPDTLVVAFAAAAELSCFLALDWPLPARVLDLYVEFRLLTNGMTLPSRSLLAAASYHGIPTITSDEKRTGRDLVMRGGPWSQEEQAEVIDYCASDVAVLGPLLDRMLPGILGRHLGLGRALHRGRYIKAVARMEKVGVPTDTDTLALLRKNWIPIQERLIAQVDAAYHVFDGTTFKVARFEDWLGRRGIAWPRTELGSLRLDRQTFREQSRAQPEVSALRELRHSLSELRLERLAVGADGRNRAALMPFGTRTGRNAPSANAYIFGPSTWLRGLIRPGSGRSLAYVDWSAQEIAIAASLSGDPALLSAYKSGDAYLAFAVMAGLVPRGATKASHPAARELAKTCLLGTNYGMQATSLAARTGGSVIAASDLLRRLENTFPVFSRWADSQVDHAILTGQTETLFGWRLRVGPEARPTSLRNFPAQANGAEMMRIAAILATERGVTVCAPVHDAFLVEGASDEITDVVACTRRAMGDAARIVLAGEEVRTDAVIVPAGGRYSDPRGRVMWQTVMNLLPREGREAPVAVAS